MRIIGKVMPEDLASMKGAGMQPKQALDAIMAEAKQRNPRADTVVVNKSASHAGWDIVALD